jgi:hypothetical protein
MTEKTNTHIDGFTMEYIPLEVKLLLNVLAAHYERKIANAKAQLSALENFQKEELEGLWMQLNKFSQPKDALPVLLRWIEARLDKDGI